MSSFANDPMGTVRYSNKTGALLIRSVNRLGHPGWHVVHFQPDPLPKFVYFYYDIGGWDGAERWELLKECIVGAPIPSPLYAAGRE